MKTARFYNKGFAPLRSGFTLIELLVVITIIATLAVVVFVALNPGARLIAARDARRTSDVDSILTAIHEDIVDSKGVSPLTDTAEHQLGTATSSCTISTGGCNVTADACLDLSSALSKYLKSIPTDPLNGTAATTHYSVQQDANGLVTVRACGTGTGTTEGTTNISASR